MKSIRAFLGNQAKVKKPINKNCYKNFTFYKATYCVKYSQHEKHAYDRGSGGMLLVNFEN